MLDLLLLATRRSALVFLIVNDVFGQSLASHALNEDEAVYLQPYLGDRALGDGVMAFPIGRSWMLPLGEMCRLLDFPIEIDVRSGVAKGLYMAKRGFHLNLLTCVAVSNGKVSHFQPSQVSRHGFEIYIDARLLESWFPLKVLLAQRESSVYLTSLEPLPVQERLERNKANAMMLGKSGMNTSVKPGPLYDYPYRFFSVPSGEVSGSWQKSSAGAASKPQFALNLAGDLLWMSSQIFLTRDAAGSFDSSRVTLFRNDSDGKMLGPLHARHISLGDMQRPGSLDLVGGLPQGRGIFLDNQRLEYRTTFAAREFHGVLPAGWSVELYQNDSLVGFQHARPDGVYQMPPVQMVFGLNNFRLVFYGPYGERREETSRIDIRQDQPEPGAFYYRISALRPLVRQARSGETADGQPRLLERPMYYLHGEYGVTSLLSAQAGAIRLQYDDGTRDFGMAGLRTVLPWVSLDLIGAASKISGSVHSSLGHASKSPGLAAQAIVRTGLGYSHVVASHSEYRRAFFSTKDNVLPSGDVLRQESAASLSSSLPFGGFSTSLGYSWQRRRYLQSSNVAHRFTFTQGVGRFNLSQSLGFTFDRSQRQKTHSMDLQLMASSFLGLCSLQAQIEGGKEREAFRFDRWGFNLTRHWESGIALQATVQGSTREGFGSNNYTFSLMRQKGRMSYTMDGTYSRSGGSSIGLRAQLSFGREPRTGRWYLDAQSLSSAGSVSALAYMDDNGNARLDPGERILEEPRFLLGGTEKDEWRPDSKVVLYNGLGADQAVSIALSGASLEDASMQPALPSYTLRPRAGVVTRVDYPVTIQGEVAGTCRMKMDGKLKEIPGLLLELLDGEGKSVHSVRSAFDGFFEFCQLPLGKYTLQVPALEVERLGLQEQPRRFIEITAGRPFSEGQDLVIEYRK